MEMRSEYPLWQSPPSDDGLPLLRARPHERQQARAAKAKEQDGSTTKEPTKDTAAEQPNSQTVLCNLCVTVTLLLSDEEDQICARMIEAMLRELESWHQTGSKALRDV